MQIQHMHILLGLNCLPFGKILIQGNNLYFGNSSNQLSSISVDLSQYATISMLSNYVQKSELYSIGTWPIPSRSSSSDLQLGFVPKFVMIICNTNNTTASVDVGFGTSGMFLAIHQLDFRKYTGNSLINGTTLDATNVRGASETASDLSYTYLAFR